MRLFFPVSVALHNSTSKSPSPVCSLLDKFSCSALLWFSAFNQSVGVFGHILPILLEACYALPPSGFCRFFFPLSEVITLYYEQVGGFALVCHAVPLKSTHDGGRNRPRIGDKISHAQGGSPCPYHNLQPDNHHGEAFRLSSGHSSQSNKPF